MSLRLKSKAPISIIFILETTQRIQNTQNTTPELQSLLLSGAPLHVLFIACRLSNLPQAVYSSSLRTDTEPEPRIHEQDIYIC
jgi:hypothetical protein